MSASANRAKGDKGPDKWKRENCEFWCQYAQAWASVKFTWGLSSTAQDLAVRYVGFAAWSGRLAAHSGCYRSEALSVGVKRPNAKGKGTGVTQ